MRRWPAHSPAWRAQYGPPWWSASSCWSLPCAGGFAHRCGRHTCLGGHTRGREEDRNSKVLSKGGQIRGLEKRGRWWRSACTPQAYCPSHVPTTDFSTAYTLCSSALAPVTPPTPHATHTHTCDGLCQPLDVLQGVEAGGLGQLYGTATSCTSSANISLLANSRSRTVTPQHASRQGASASTKHTQLNHQYHSGVAGPESAAWQTFPSSLGAVLGGLNDQHKEFQVHLNNNPVCI